MPQASIDYGIMMTDLISILECNKESVKFMRACFDHMVHHVGKKMKMYLDIIESNEYEKINSVQSFFKLLGPYLKSPDCSLLKALVQATKCEEAMERLTKYLDISTNVKLDNDFSKLPVPRRPSQEHALVPESEAASSATSPRPVVRSEPTVDHSLVPVTTTVAEDEMSLGMLRQIQSLVCGLLRVPQFSLQYNCVEPGSVIIKWATSKKIAFQMQSIVLDDGDLKLLLRENIVSIQIGMEYTVTTGNRMVSTA